MRITGGLFRGRKINAPANLPVRPTTDFAKTALFNILANHFNFEAVVALDLYAGTGSISFEFLSRGIKEMTCVDESIKCISFIKKTASELNASNIHCIRSEVLRFLKQANKKWDIIFADPPYDLNDTDSIPQIVFENNLLAANGWLIIEHQSKRTLVTSIPLYQLRKYGNSAFSVFKNEEQYVNEKAT